MSNNKTIEIPTLSWKLLRQLVATPGWSKASKDLYIAGKLDFEGKFDTPEFPKGGDEKEWAQKLISREFMGKEVDAIERCIDYHVKEGKLGSDRYVFAIISVFCNLD